MDERRNLFNLGIGKRIAIRRKEINMTQEELANKLGYKHKTSISKIEKGSNELTQSMIPEIADALDTTIGYLMGWEQSESTSYHLSSTEREIIRLYRSMNMDGKSKVEDYICDIAENPRYQEDMSSKVG